MARRTSFRRRPSSPVARAPRMPQIEDLPHVAQNQLRVMRGEGQPPSRAPETRRRSLLEKLAAFGITRHDDGSRSARRPRSRRPRRAPLPRPQASRSGRARPAPAARRSRRAPLVAGSTRTAGRPASSGDEDDHLDIPAFLRRQQN